MRNPPNDQLLSLLSFVLIETFLLFRQIVRDHLRSTLFFKNPYIDIIVILFLFLELLKANRPTFITLNLFPFHIILTIFANLFFGSSNLRLDNFPNQSQNGRINIDRIELLDKNLFLNKDLLLHAFIKFEEMGFVA